MPAWKEQGGKQQQYGQVAKPKTARKGGREWSEMNNLQIIDMQTSRKNHTCKYTFWYLNFAPIRSYRSAYSSWLFISVLAIFGGWSVRFLDSCVKTHLGYGKQARMDQDSNHNRTNTRLKNSEESTLIKRSQSDRDDQKRPNFNF